MKDKTNRIINLHDVLTEIQTFLDKEANRVPSDGNSSMVPQPQIQVDLSSTSRSPVSQSVTVAQYYLSRHRSGAKDLLETLPTDVFIVC